MVISVRCSCNITFYNIIMHNNQKQLQLSLPEIAETVDYIAPTQGNLSKLKNRFDVYSQQLNNSVQQTQTLNEMISNDLDEYAQLEHIQTTN